MDNLLSLATVAKRLEVSRMTVHRQVKLYVKSQGKQGLGPVTVLGKRTRRIAESALERFVKRQTV